MRHLKLDSFTKSACTYTSIRSWRLFPESRERAVRVNVLGAHSCHVDSKKSNTVVEVANRVHLCETEPSRYKYSWEFMSTEGTPLMMEGVVEDEDDVQVSRKVINYEPIWRE